MTAADAGYGIMDADAQAQARVGPGLATLLFINETRHLQMGAALIYKTDHSFINRSTHSDLSVLSFGTNGTQCVANSDKYNILLKQACIS